MCLVAQSVVPKKGISHLCSLVLLFEGESERGCVWAHTKVLQASSKLEEEKEGKRGEKGKGKK